MLSGIKSQINHVFPETHLKGLIAFAEENETTAEVEKAAMSGAFAIKQKEDRINGMRKELEAKKAEREAHSATIAGIDSETERHSLIERNITEQLNIQRQSEWQRPFRTRYDSSVCVE